MQPASATGEGYDLAPMTQADAQPVMDILNHYIETGFAAFPQRRLPHEFFAALLQAARSHPSLVARDRSGQLAGFGLLRPFHFADSLAATAEFSCFLHPGHTRKGLGGLILERLCQEAAGRGIRQIVAEISSLNQPSLDFHAAHGFATCGRLKSVGRKLDQDFDVILMQRSLAGA